MNISNALAGLKRWVTQNEQRRAIEEFTCGHCDRNDQCGRAVNDRCVCMLEQIEQGDNWRYRAAGFRRALRMNW